MLMNNTAYFNQNEFIKKVEKALKNGFENDNKVPPHYWFNLFGKRKLKIYDSAVVDKPSFPCCHILATGVPSTANSHSTQVNQYSRVLLEIQIQNVATESGNKEFIGNLIVNKVIQILQTDFGLIMSNNVNIQNYDEKINRAFLRWSFIYDNINKIIYKGV